MIKNLFMLILLSILPITMLYATSSSLLSSTEKEKRLDVIILNSPTVFYVGASEQQGYEYELISDFAKSITSISILP